MKYLLSGATFGWIVTAVMLSLSGQANFGTVIVGMAVGIGWCAYAAVSIIALLETERSEP